MTNGDKLMKVNLYDLLLLINSRIADYSQYCIIDAIEGRNETCPPDLNCEKCLQNYLIRESVRPLKLEKREYK